MANKLSVLDFWTVDGAEWPCLQKIAMRVFCMVASTAASERNFPTYGFIHSKLRNTLGKESVRKLVYIKTNSQQIDGHVVAAEDSILDQSDNEGEGEGGGESDTDDSDRESVVSEIANAPETTDDIELDSRNFEVMMSSDDHADIFK